MELWNINYIYLIPIKYLNKWVSCLTHFTQNPSVQVYDVMLRVEGKNAANNYWGNFHFLSNYYIICTQYMSQYISI